MKPILRDQRGTTTLEFGLIAIPFFLVLFGIFDLGFYGITVYSLQTLANETARGVIINCYSTDLINSQSPAGCTADPYPTAAQKQAIAPFLYAGGLTPTVTISPGASALTVTASQPNFTMIMPFWGTALNAPSEAVTLPF
jgi:Flp pilus assembly protein TadG